MKKYLSLDENFFDPIVCEEFVEKQLLQSVKLSRLAILNELHCFLLVLKLNFKDCAVSTRTYLYACC